MVLHDVCTPECKPRRGQWWWTAGWCMISPTCTVNITNYDLAQVQVSFHANLSDIIASLAIVHMSKLRILIIYACIPNVDMINILNSYHVIAQLVIVYLTYSFKALKNA